MSTNHNHHVTDELLDRHVGALHDDPVPPDGPSPAALDATLAMLRDERDAQHAAPPVAPVAAVTGRRSFFERALTMTFTQRLAAAVMITVGALTLYLMFGVFSTVAFADVAEKFKGARTIQYTSSVTFPGKPAVNIRTLVAEPERMRTEMPDGHVSIMDGHTTLMLNPRAKTATRTTFTGADEPKGPAGKDLSLVTAMRSLGEQKGEAVGEKVIDGIPSVGFKTELAGREVTIWANKKTADPVRLEMAISAGGVDATMVMSEFVIDAPLDDALFSLEPPAGYKLETKQFALAELGETAEEVAGLLRAYTDKSEGGAFPNRLFDWADIHKVTGDSSGKIGGISGRLFGHPGTYGYTGKGVKRGERDKIVFWYKPDVKAKTVRAVFGDLRIEEVAPDRIPATNPAAK